MRRRTDVRYDEWAPVYERIRVAFGFDWVLERHSADRLIQLIPGSRSEAALASVRARVAGRDVIVVGLAPQSGPPPLWRLPTPRQELAIVAADGAAERCLGAGLVPDVVVTDLDGPVPSEIAAQARGSLVAVHAHGDNEPALERWVPEFGGPVLGSWAGPPDQQLFDAGGFTDGDRSAYLAAECGARRVLLWGFDFAEVDELEPSLRHRKASKLRWAAESLRWLADRGGTPILHWRRDGSIVPYVAGVTTQ